MFKDSPSSNLALILVQQVFHYTIHTENHIGLVTELLNRQLRIWLVRRQSNKLNLF